MKNQTNKRLLGQIGQVRLIDHIFRNKTKGFYVESGADNGEDISNTLYFELFRNWSGLLIEPNPKRFRELISKNRKSYAINACLGVRPYPELVEFTNALGVGGISGLKASKKLEGMRAGLKSSGHYYKSQAQCFPFVQILESIGSPEVDLFSLDVEGAEEAVLEQIPWDRVKIKVILVEVEHSDAGAVRRTLEDNGYSLYANLMDQDYVFVRNDFLPQVPPLPSNLLPSSNETPKEQDD